MFESTQEAIDGADDWRHAVTNLIDYYTRNDYCFSSGEIAAEIRNVNPDINFSVLWVGEYVRDLFHSGSILYLVEGNTGGDGDGETRVPAFMVPRTTEGKYPHRTPAGIQVFVYGPHPSMCEKHEFEVEIPTPPRGMKLVDSDAPDHDEEWHQDEKDQARRSPGDMTVRVHTDKRVCFTRPLIEAFFHVRKQPVQAGGSVFIRQDGSKLVLTLDEQPGASEYNLSTSRGRVLYPLTTGQPGTTFKVDITGDAIIVDLDN